ncbi:MAG: EVE domain-containing protein [Candidatus Thermoplasmatota archaeon]|nr:EVE domain-containing protein [Candidatus Thermoplasmatota archaeon]
MNKKLFGRDSDMRSTFLKYDPCVTGQYCTVECKDCMVSLISDRFLGEKFAKEVLSKKFGNTKNLFTYVLIADTIGCNLNCWFCYAWKYLNMNDAQKIKTCFLSAEELAEQFACKIKKTADLNHIKSQIKEKIKYTDQEREKILRHVDMNLPFSRIRISGGEPLFSNSHVLQNYKESEDLITQTIPYWIDFFEALDGMVGQIKHDRLINIATFDSNWQNLEYPVWLTEADDRIMIRFDTNGLIFGNNKYTEFFYSELFRLFKENKLNNINIQIDYSFKGSTTKEYKWSQKKDLPTTSDNNDKKVDLVTHPQVKGYTNIINNIAELTKKDKNFKNCVSVTVEKGIDHDRNNKLWLYYPQALDWYKLSSNLGFVFSDVENRFDLSFHWNFSAKVYRYTKRGGMIKLLDGSENVDVNSASIAEMTDFRREHISSDMYMTLVYPVDHPIKVPKKPQIKRQMQISASEQNFWIITGSEENLRYGVKHSLWGVGKKYEELWTQLKKDDFVFFYCTRPVSGIVGYAKFTHTKFDPKPLWPNENPEKESKYPLRINFETTYITQDWHRERIPIYETGISYYGGLNYVEPDKKQVLVKKLKVDV